MNEDTLKILNFMNEIEKFKIMKRHCRKSNLESETNSDHTWHLCMLIFLLQDKLKEKKLNIFGIYETKFIYENLV
jgi:5'-deoxynucleotidase YfbR-like HD superfamily hydrolase